MSIFTTETKAGDIVVQLPRASSILKSYRIDFCCGGDRPIGEIFIEKQLDGEKILGELTNLYEEIMASGELSEKWEEMSSEKLILHIIRTHHDYLRQQLPEISFYVNKINQVHGMNHLELERVYQDFQALKQDLEQHIDEEEKTVFPTILLIEKETDQAKKEELIKLIEQMEQEHQNAGRLLEDMREITKDYLLPADACTTYQLTFNKLEELESDLFQHIHLENNILFPRMFR